MRNDEPDLGDMPKATLARHLLVTRGAALSPVATQAQRTSLTDHDPSDGPGRGLRSGGYRSGATDNNNPGGGASLGRGR